MARLRRARLLYPRRSRGDRVRDQASDTAAMANLACLGWLRNRNCLLKHAGYEDAAPCPTSAQFKFGNGRMGTAKHAGDVPIVLSGEAE